MPIFFFFFWRLKDGVPLGGAEAAPGESPGRKYIGCATGSSATTRVMALGKKGRKKKRDQEWVPWMGVPQLEQLLRSN